MSQFFSNVQIILMKTFLCRMSENQRNLSKRCNYTEFNLKFMNQRCISELGKFYSLENLANEEIALNPIKKMNIDITNVDIHHVKFASK